MNSLVIENQYQHLLVFDLSSYASAISIINQFVDEQQIKVFEISPCGSNSFLLLVCSNLISAKFIYSQVISIYHASVLDSCLIEVVSFDLLQAYLSQKTSKINNNLIIFESSKLASTFVIASKMISNGEGIVDFRVIRTQPPQVILTTTFDNNSLEYFDQIQLNEVKKHLVENITSVVKNYYQY